MYQLLRNKLNTKGLVEAIEHLPYKPVPKWLGDFQFKMFGQAYGRHYGHTSGRLREAVVELAWIKPRQTFTTVFVQRYKQGQQVLPHRDPKNNVGHTIIGVLGDFEGASTYMALGGGDVDGGTLSFKLNSGDVLVLPCTIDGKQGPMHWVEPVTSGTRYAIILNTIT